ncbi:sigma-54-dependent transcriptional regulator [Candidatus Magnetominusculus xianensis]|uniref:DNA-binding transcriptional response regulator n=1 Tax=Candidatus Magnetominusculus xianensis TaxID=1748249 RepID=A0ABR5SJQ3_9BACT|nr:sigma-54 dependent transcriptional regulator [Candidatus Magnetominusculus xianensis]KWT92826.1 DNA-binding transcriptional response regulator [Candidatus Magnetominusculus xianensis]MBF0403415.1 sigma-54-dependent Fis family transcriptional regulator [Nitrospirota bacterium]
MNQGKILVVEDEKSMNDILKLLLEGEGYDVISAYDGREGLEILKKDIFDIVITDIKMPLGSGHEILKGVKELSPETMVLMITAFGTTEDAIEAMKSGAYDYINKPFKIDEIRLIVKNALERRLLSREVKNLRSQVVFTFQKVAGKSKAIRDLLLSIPKVAESSANVLITGESGCGKELIARAIHNLSKRVAKEFIPINCAALPEGLLESELFGYMRGSFTGANSNKTGLFEAADGGIIFLDEIGDMPLNLQAKLLRVLEDGSFRRIGGTKDITVDVRIISATNKILKDEAAAGRFRADLFYRLNVIPIHLPPLRDRKEDIPVLIDHYLDKNNAAHVKFTRGAIDVMMKYPWPGNVRELENTLDRLLTFTDKSVITEEEIPEDIRSGQTVSQPVPCLEGVKFIEGVEFSEGGVSLDDILMETEKRYLLMALEKAGGSKTDAARLLNISFRQFRHRLKKYGIN